MWLLREPNVALSIKKAHRLALPVAAINIGALVPILLTDQRNKKFDTMSLPSRLPAAGQAGQNRSAGDVLNDIGSMLADLTDELDAMLHSERDTN